MPKRRGQGDGALFFSPSRNRWLGYVELPRAASGRRRRREVRGRTRAEAQAYLRRVRAELTEGITTDRRMTVAQLLERWLERGLPNLSAAARANAEWAVRKHLVPALGARKVAELTPEDIEDWLTGLCGGGPSRTPSRGGPSDAGVVPRAAKIDQPGHGVKRGPMTSPVGEYHPATAPTGYSRSTIARLHGTLTRALDWGQARGHVGRNVSKLVVTPTGPTRQRRALTVGEARRLLDACAGDPMGAAISCGLLLGLRPGELIALQWQDVDLTEGTIDVCRYLKTRAARRTLKMPKRLHDILIAHVAEQIANDTSGDLLFATSAGTPIDRANLRRSLRRIAARAGLESLTTYELRHSMVSILSAAGVPLEQVADVAGHATPAVTGSVYRHSISPSIDAAATVMDRELG